MRHRPGFKLLCAYLAFSLLYLDIAWALDVRQAIGYAIATAREGEDARRAGRRLPGALRRLVLPAL